MKNLVQLIFLGTVLIFFSGCGLLNGDDKTFDAGPILFISDKSGTNQLYSMNEEGEDVQQLTHDLNFPIYEAKWSPDGQKIAVISEVGDSNDYSGYRRAVFIMDADGSKRYQLTPQWITVQDSTRGSITYGGAWYIAWSPDSKQITYSRLMVPEALGSFDVFQMNIDGTNEQRITSDLNVNERVTDWAPDGISFWGSITDSAEDSTGTAIRYTRLVTIDKDGEVIKSWGEPGEAWQWPIISQNGDKISYIHVNKMHQHDLLQMNLNGSDQSYLTKGQCKYPRPISWSADDSKILVHCFEGELKGGEIWILDVETSEIIDITPFEEGYILTTSWR